MQFQRLAGGEFATLLILGAGNDTFCQWAAGGGSGVLGRPSSPGTTCASGELAAFAQGSPSQAKDTKQ
jgi:hypothetical protein